LLVAVFRASTKSVSRWFLSGDWPPHSDFHDAAKSAMTDYPTGLRLTLKYNPKNERQSVLVAKVADSS
jgi:hypothetical protein